VIRTCNGQDENLVRRDTPEGKWRPCDCGFQFDDVFYMVTYPHRRIRSRAERDAAVARLLRGEDVV
jgi:hypothetical protein